MSSNFADENLPISLYSNLPPLTEPIYDRIEFDEKRICISGMSGVGKSTLAIKYGHSRKEAQRPALVRFFDAKTEVTLKADFVSLAQKLNISEDIERDRLASVNKKLEELINMQIYFEILFIFDNVEDFECVKKYVCSLPEAISVLVTCKETVEDEGWHNIELKHFLVEESKGYIQKVIKINETEIIEEILKRIKVKIGDQVIPFHLHYFSGLVYKDLKQFDKALKQFKKALEIQEKLSTDDNDKLADLHLTIGNVYMKINNPDNAKNCFLKTLDIRKKLLANDHILIFETYVSIGKACLAKKEFVKASKYFEEAKATKYFEKAKERLLGDWEGIPEERLAVLLVLKFLGEVYLKLQQFKNALEQFKEALTIYTKINSPDDNKSLADLHKIMGETNLEWNKPNEAKEHFIKSKDLFTRVNDRN